MRNRAFETRAVGIQKMIQTQPVKAYRVLFDEEPSIWMSRVLEAVFLRRCRKIGVSGAFSTSKTYFEPRLALMFVLGFISREEDVVVGVGAPNDTHARTKFWGEFKKMYGKRPKAYGGELMESGVWRTSKPMSYVQTIIPGQSITAGMKKAHGGFGTHGNYVMALIDDGQGVAEPLYEAYNNAVSSGTYSLIVTFGNPLAQAGTFFEFCSQPGCEHIAISGLDYPNVQTWMCGEPPPIPAALSGTWFDEHVHKHCRKLEEDEERQPFDFQWFENPGRIDVNGDPWPMIWFRPDAWFIANGLGQFPDVTGDNPVGYGDAIAAQECQVTLIGDPTDCGLDLAEFGTCETVFDFKYETEEGIPYHIRKVYPGKNDPDEVIGIATRYLNQYPNMHLWGDAIGVGSGVMSVLYKRFGDRVHPVKWSPMAAVGSIIMGGESVPAKRQFYDFKAQLQLGVAELYRTGQIAICEDKEFVNQATSVRYGTHNDGRLIMASKRPKSPEDGRILRLDRWDAHCLSHCGTWLRKEKTVWYPPKEESGRDLSLPEDRGADDEGRYRSYVEELAGMEDR